MTQFVLLYRNTPDARRDAMASPDKAQQVMKKWRAWFDEMNRNGHLKNIGQPLEEAGKVVRGKSRMITDGPFTETKDVVGGYSLIEAGDLDEAVRIASGCPVVEHGGSVEVRPVMQFGT